MAWKQDLAKLKQQLSPEPPAPAPKPKPVPKPTGPGRMEDEDAVFLSAMGLNPSSSRKAKPTPSPAPPDPTPVPEPVTPETFHQAVKELKGLKPLARGIQDLPESPAPLPAPIPALTPIHQDLPQSLPPVAAEPQPKPDPAPKPAPKADPQPTAPQRFQLAAGMALEVDASLDLRGHSLADAMDRLQDRLGDGIVLGWRSLQVNLGPDPVLHEGLIKLLATGQAPMVSRYAQAPVPMGGTQAWLLYFGPSPAQP